MRKVIFKIYRKSVNLLKGKGFGKIPLVHPIYRLVFNLTKPKEIKIIDFEGSKTYVNPKDREISLSLLTTGEYEPFIIKTFKKFLKPNMIVCDVGANIGLYSLVGANKVKEVYAFEPEKTNFEFLKKNIKLNNYKNIIAINKAVSNKKGKANLFMREFRYGGGTLDSRNRLEDNNKIKVIITPIETITLDDFFKDKEIDLMKIDVEGSEGLVLEGAKKLIKRSKNLKIIIEFWDYGIKHSGIDTLGLLHHLKKDFKIRLINEKKETLEEISPEEIISKCKEELKGRGVVYLLLEK